MCRTAKTRRTPGAYLAGESAVYGDTLNALGSVLLPPKVIAMNMLSPTATFGDLVRIFQAAGPLGRRPSRSPPPGASRICDISDLKAPEDKSAGRFAAESRITKGSRLELHDLAFGGVVTVDTAAGPKRVLKFSAAAVTIRGLKMAVPVGPQIQHIDGAQGSPSTLRGDHLTMYVESLTGTLSGVEGIPCPRSSASPPTPFRSGSTTRSGNSTSSSNSAWRTPTSTRPDRQAVSSSPRGSTGTERSGEAGTLPGLHLETDRSTLVETDRFPILWRES